MMPLCAVPQPSTSREQPSMSSDGMNSEAKGAHQRAKHALRESLDEFLETLLVPIAPDCASAGILIRQPIGSFWEEMCEQFDSIVSSKSKEMRTNASPQVPEGMIDYHCTLLRSEAKEMVHQWWQRNVVMLAIDIIKALIDWLLPQDRCRAHYDLDLNAALARAQSYRVLAICSSNFLENGRESWATCIDAWLQLAAADANAYKHSLMSMGQSQDPPGPSVLDHLPAGSNRDTCLEGYLFAKAEVDKRQQNLASQQMPMVGDRGGAGPLPTVIGVQDFLFEHGHDGVRIRCPILKHVDAAEEGMDWEEIEAAIPFSPIEDWEMLDGASDGSNAMQSPSTSDPGSNQLQEVQTNLAGLVLGSCVNQIWQPHPLQLLYVQIDDFWGRCYNVTRLLRCAYTVPVTHLLDSVEQHALIVQIELCRDDSDDHACKHLYLMLERSELGGKRLDQWQCFTKLGDALCSGSIERRIDWGACSRARSSEPDFPVRHLRQILSLVDNSLEMEGANSLWFSDVIPYMIARVQHGLSSGEEEYHLGRNIQQVLYSDYVRDWIQLCLSIIQERPIFDPVQHAREKAVAEEKQKRTLQAKIVAEAIKVILYQTDGQLLLGADLEVLMNTTVRTSGIHASMWNAKRICREVAETGLWQFVEYSTPRDRDVGKNQTSFLLTSWKQADFQGAGHQVEFVEEALACILQDKQPGDDGSACIRLSMSERYFKNGETPLWLSSSEASLEALQGQGVLPSATGTIVKLTYPRHFEDAVLEIMCVATRGSPC